MKPLLTKAVSVALIGLAAITGPVAAFAQSVPFEGPRPPSQDNWPAITGTAIGRRATLSRPLHAPAAAGPAGRGRVIGRPRPGASR